MLQSPGVLEQLAQLARAVPALDEIARHRPLTHPEAFVLHLGEMILRAAERRCRDGIGLRRQIIELGGPAALERLAECAAATPLPSAFLGNRSARINARPRPERFNDVLAVTRAARALEVAAANRHLSAPEFFVAEESLTALLPAMRSAVHVGARLPAVLGGLGGLVVLEAEAAACRASAREAAE